jgi:hypothetical protein
MRADVRFRRVTLHFSRGTALWRGPHFPDVHAMNARILGTTFAAALGAFALQATPVQAQGMRDLPATPELSLAASVGQTVGVTNIEVTYSSPAARERTIWGELVPWDAPWRFGANAPTRITFSDDVTVGGTDVAAGTYTVIAFPSADEWTIVLNTDPSGRGAYAYDAANDVASATVTPTEAPYRERMLIYFANTTNDSTELTMEWAGLGVALPIGVDTAAIVDANIASTVQDLWRPQFNAARYLLDSGGDLDRAHELMAASIDIHETWWNRWFMALIERERGENASARENAERASAIGGGDPVFEGFFKDTIESALNDWPRR